MTTLQLHWHLCRAGLAFQCLQDTPLPFNLLAYAAWHPCTGSTPSPHYRNSSSGSRFCTTQLAPRRSGLHSMAMLHACNSAIAVPHGQAQTRRTTPFGASRPLLLARAAACRAARTTGRGHAVVTASMTNSRTAQLRKLLAGPEILLVSGCWQHSVAGDVPACERDRVVAWGKVAAGRPRAGVGVRSPDSLQQTYACAPLVPPGATSCLGLLRSWGPALREVAYPPTAAETLGGLLAWSIM